MKILRRAALVCILFLSLAAWARQESAAQPAAPAAAAAEGQEHSAKAGEAREPAGESKESGDENDKFKKSAAVQWLAKVFHIPLDAAYWVFYGLDFAIVAGVVIVFARSKLPGLFRARNEMIRRSMEEAQRSSDEARARLGQIEIRLSRLDAEIAEMRAAAEAEATQEAERIKAAAEQDQRHIVAAAEQEIAAASQVARRELKTFAAGLAVDLAERRLKIDAETDRALVRRFAGQFGKDGE